MKESKILFTFQVTEDMFDKQVELLEEAISQFRMTELSAEQLGGIIIEIAAMLVDDYEDKETKQ